MVKMSLAAAVSASESPPAHPRGCLLPGAGATTYQCAETAASMKLVEEQVWLWAYWEHYRTHCEAYIQWALNRKLGDPTIRAWDAYEAAQELVIQVLVNFRRTLEAGRYDPAKGPPCAYIKRSLRNLFQDYLKRGRQPTEDECIQCWEQQQGGCPAFRHIRTREQARARCYRLPHFQALDPDESVAELQLATAGIHGAGSGEGAPQSALARPTEEQALEQVMATTVSLLMLETLNADQHTVLAQTFWEQRSSQEIALLIEKQPANVDQIRKRALAKLYRALQP